MYELKLEKFQGPLDKLLELIEAQRLEIGEISLAQVTDDFLKYLRSLTEARADLRLIADFISVASRLILIKSKTLLPDLALTEEEEQSIGDLERRLRLYKEFKPMMGSIASLWGGKKASFGREYFLSAMQSSRSTSSGQAGIFYPGENFGLGEIVQKLNALFESIQKFELETQTIKEKIVTIEEKMQEIVGRLQAEVRSSFSGLSRSRPRSEAILIFLAILHLAREQFIILEQAEHFSDILIKKK